MFKLDVHPIKCPNCEAFVDTDASFCPYCSTCLWNAPWKQGRWVHLLIIAAAIGILYAADRLFGLNLLDTLKTAVASKSP